ncbi:hypothetical protein [Agromyces mangrovi Wang et al. 2018]|uniref:hypothetical protein n=1 Tax=Agromyces mangrovi TaxID=1858653 RepID=UPI002572E641|nr:hypothetical protein [Agromyces mangrovi]BDZ65508.1 hypothetical protein GCM10025877_24460 [Agromyces mangrovi]
MNVRLPLVALLVTAGALVAAVPAAGDEVGPSTPIAGGVGVRPADGDRTGFELAADPAGRYEDTIEVLNLGDEPRDIEVSASDLEMSEGGLYGLPDPGDASVGSGGWVSFDGATSVVVRVGARESTRVDFAVDVPADAQPGDHAAAVVAWTAEGTEVGTVMVRQRVAIRLLVRVAGEQAPELELEDVRMAYAGAFDPSLGRATVEFTLRNTGNLALAATPEVVLSQLAGTWTRHRTGEPTNLILPGASVVQSMVLEEVPALGLIAAEVTVATEVAPGATAPGALPAPSASAQVLAVPWTIVVGIAAVLLAIALTVVASRGRAAAHERRIEERVRRELEHRR